jgi:UDP-GlcNAc:undecaprenyl-phosphate GlcNAc-1-phosphate transferase
VTINILLLVLASIGGAAAAYAFSPLAGYVAALVGAVDQPGPRKVHLTPIPRLGGLAVIGGFIIGLAVVRSSWFSGNLALVVPKGVFLGLLPIVLVSFADDIRSMRPWVKAGCHLAGAAIAVLFGVVLAPDVTVLGSKIHLGWLSWPLSIFWLVGITNAFNIVDGLDGLAAGLALIASLAMTAVFAAAGQWDTALIPAALSGALIGFLPYNTHPARMFLGDTGAAAIGFILGTLALKGGSTTSAGLAAALPIFLMGLPIADTLIAIVRRLVRRATSGTGRVFEADRNHIHHRLLVLGVSHQRAVLLLYAAGLVVAAVALLSVFASDRHAAVLLTALLLAGGIGVQRLGYDEFALLRRGTLLGLYKAPVLKFALFSVLADVCLVSLSAYVAVGLRSDDWLLRTHAAEWIDLLVWLVPATLLAFRWTGLYRGRWSLAGLDDYLRVGLVNVGAAVAVAAVGGYAIGVVPVAVIGIYAFVSSQLLIAARASQRILESAYHRALASGTPVLIYGHGPAAAAAVRYLSSFEGDGVLRPIGFLDDDPRMKGRTVGGLSVKGTLEELEMIIRGTGAHGVVVAGTLPEGRLEQAYRECENLEIEVFRLHHRPAARNETVFAVAPASAADTPLAAAPGASRMSGAKCPKCHEWRLNRSRSHGAFEQLRRRFTTRRPHRCANCGWRGWLEPELLSQAFQPVNPTEIQNAWDALDLDALDDPAASRKGDA